MLVSFFNNSSMNTKLINAKRMYQTTHRRKEYAAPQVKVVRFMVEQGFAGSNYNNVVVTPQTQQAAPGMDPVTQGADLTPHFQ